MKKILRIVNVALLAAFCSMVISGLVFGGTCGSSTDGSGSTHCTGSNPWTADSASYQDINHCANTCASRGNTVNVPAGTVTWANQVYITKAISLVGAGSSTSGTYVTTGIRTANVTNSRYNETYQVPMIHFALSDSDDGYLTRISGFRLNGEDANGSWSPVIAIWGTAQSEASWSSVVNKIRVDNNYIRGRRTSGWDGRAINFYYYLKGVVDNNYIEPEAATSIYYGRDRNTENSWSRTSGPYASWDNGTEQNIFIENNTLGRVDTGNSVVTGRSASFVLRYNDIVNTNSSGYIYMMDSHGRQTGAYRGAFGMEVYGNHFKLPSGTINYDLAEFRASRHKVFYNYVDSVSVGDIRIHAAYADTYHYGAYTPGRTCTGGLYSGYTVCSHDQRRYGPEASYFWNNRTPAYMLRYTNELGSDPAVSSTGPYPCPLDTTNSATTNRAISKDTHFWLDWENWSSSTYNGPTAGCGHSIITYTYTGVSKPFDGTSGIGCGALSSRPANCTVGVGYWATNQSCATIPEGSYGKSVSAANQLSGALYTCTATNTWTKTYEPYTYPHPYRDDADVSPPQYVTGTATPSGEQACPSNPTNVTVGFTVTDQTPSGVVCKGCNSGESCTSASTYAEIAAMAGVINFSSSCSGTSCAQTAINSSACDSTKLVYARCTDGTNVMTSSVVIPYTMADDTDTDAPTLISQEVLANGTTLRLTFSEAVQAGDEETTGFTFSRTRGETPGNVTVTCTDPFSNVTTIDCQLASTVYSTDTDTTLAYTQAGNEIEDMAGNDLASIAEPVAVTNSSTQTGTSATSLWNHSDTPSLTSYPWSAATVGTRWKSSAAGQVSQLCFYKHADMDAEEPHTAGIWNDSGTLLGSVTWTEEEETESGWQCKALSANVDINANEYYTVGVYCPSRRVHTTNYFAQDYTNSTFTAGTENGVHTYGESLARPTTSSSTDRNWWVDFVFVPTGSGQWAVAVSKTGDGCTITDSVIVADTETGEATVTVNNGWAVSIGGTCPAGSGVLTGNSYVWTTGSITEDCTVVATCVEVQLVPWVAP